MFLFYFTCIKKLIHIRHYLYCALHILKTYLFTDTNCYFMVSKYAIIE